MRFWELCQSLHLSTNMNIKDAVGIKWETFGFLIMLVTVVEYLYIFFFFGNEQEFVIIDSIFVKKMLSSMSWGNQTCIDFLKLNTTAFFFLSRSFLFISLRLFCCALKCWSQHISDETIKCRCWHSIRGKGWVRDSLCWTLSHCIHLGGAMPYIYICTLNAFPDLFSKP